MLKMFGKIFGTKNDKEVKKYLKRADEINKLEKNYSSLKDNELQEKFNQLKLSVKNNEKTLDEVLNESFAITREASKRILGMRHYDVQLVGGMVLHDGRIAEMKTGEGKTLVATLPIILNAIEGKGVHLVTVNDYLAERDAKELEPLYNFLGFTIGAITGNIKGDGERKKSILAI